MANGFPLSSTRCNELGYGRLLTISSCGHCSLIKYSLFSGARCTYNGGSKPLPFNRGGIPDWCPLPCAGSYGDGEIASASASPSPEAKEDE